MSGKNRTVDVDKYKKAVVAFGKKKGHITVAELRELLPPDIIDHENSGRGARRRDPSAASGRRLRSESLSVRIRSQAHARSASNQVEQHRGDQ